MNSTSRTRAIVIAAALAGTASVLVAPSASAEPKPTSIVRAHKGQCLDVATLAARLRAAGLTAQAAHNAAILTARNCS
jgi:hypothetical protein